MRRPLPTLLAVALLLTALPATAIAANGDVTIADATVSETDTPTSVAIEVVSEGGIGGQDGSVDWEVVLTAGPGSADDADVTVANGTVQIDELNLIAGERTGTFDVEILPGDGLFEADETFTIVLSNPSAGLTIPDDTAVITITDDDGGRLSVLDASLPEGDGDIERRLVVRIALAEPVDHATIVDYTTADGTATEGEDYRPRPEGDRSEGNGTLTIPADADSGIFDIRILVDEEQEGDETIIVTLSNPRTDDEDHTATILDGEGIATILGDDGGPTGGGDDDDDDDDGGDGGADLAIDAGADLAVDSREELDLEATLSGASASATVTWDFDDGQTASGTDVTHAWRSTGSYDVEVTVADDGETATDLVTVTVTDVANAGRAAGQDRVGTAVRAALDHWETASTVLLATSSNFPDALAAGPYAATLDAPLLLTPPDVLPPAVSSTLRDLATRTVVILGGVAAVSGDVEASLRQLGLTVERIEGDDRFATAGQLASRVGVPLTGNQGESVPPTAIIANGTSFPDALGAGAYNALDNPLPVLLSASGDVPNVTMERLAALGVRDVLLLGGPAALSDGVQNELAVAGYAVTRLAGVDRYATSVAVAADALRRFGDTQARPVFVTGQNYPDGLAAGALAARIGGPVILVPPATLPTGTRSFLTSNAEQLDDPVFLGGEVAITSANEQAITTALNAEG